MKKILSILLALTFILTLLVACGSAEHDPMSGEKPSKYSKGLDYKVNGDHCIITGLGNCKDTEIYIPEEINGKIVRKIAAYAFRGNSTITKIWLPDTITEIGQEAFKDCSNLKIINIPQSVKTLGRRMFVGCVLDEFYCYSPYINENYDFYIPEARKIVYGGFDAQKSSNNEALEEVILLDTVKEIRYGGFKECTNLKQITIPGSVTTIGQIAFSGCSSLTSITLPNSITRIGASAFQNCTNLTSITYMGTMAEWENVDRTVYRYEVEEQGLSNWYKNVPATVVHCTDGDVPIQ